MPMHLDTGSVTPQNQADLDLAARYMENRDPMLTTMLENRDFTVRITSGPTQVGDAGGGANIILWNPKEGMAVMTPQGTVEVQSAVAGLIHEMIHAYFGLREQNSMTKAQISAMEQTARQIEALILKSLGEPTRGNYYDAINTIQLNNPTMHTKGANWVQMNKDGTMRVDPYTGNPYAIPELDPLPPIEVGGGSEGTGGNWGGLPGDGAGWEIWVPGGIEMIDPSLPRGEVDVIPGASAPVVVDTGVILTPQKPITVANDEIAILVGVPSEQAM